MTDLLKNNTKFLNNYRPNQEENEINLVELLAILVDGKWLAIMVTLTVFSLGIAKAFLDKPVYKADVMLQIDQKSRTLVGMESLTDLFKNTCPNTGSEIALF